MFSVHTTSKDFKNRGFTLELHETFSVHTTPEEFKNATSRARRSHDYSDYIVVDKIRFQNVFRPHENEKAGVLKFLRCEERFRKFRFRDG